MRHLIFFQFYKVKDHKELSVACMFYAYNVTRADIYGTRIFAGLRQMSTLLHCIIDLNGHFLDE